MNALLEFWKNRKCPIINGVLFPDGFVERFDAWAPPRPRGTTGLISRGKVRLPNPMLLEFTHLAELGRIEDSANGIVLTCGEGGMGTDGFVAMTDLADRPKWIAFFDFSNPFVAVEIVGDEVLAKNNPGEIWHFSIGHPSRIYIESR